MPRRRLEGVPRYRADDLWRKIGEPPAGARYRGYLRFSHEAGHYGLTTQSQREHIHAYGEARGWICDGWDEEPATTAKYEEIERRPAFRRHLEALEQLAAARGPSEPAPISLSYMADRWARNKIVAYVSLSRLRRAGVWWATSDGRWTIDRTEEDGWDVAFAVEVSLNAGYWRRLSEKFRDAKITRAKLGLFNGDLMYGYLRAPELPRPLNAPASYKAPRQAPVRDPQDFERLVQLGQWAASGLTDRQVAEKANSLGWRLPTTAKATGPARHYLGDDEEGRPRYSTDAARISGPRPFTKDTVRAMLIRPFPRAFSSRSDRGTILAPDGTRIEGGHPAAWDWELWHRMDEQRALRGAGGARGQIEACETRALRPYRVWPFSGIVVCAGCGSRLRAQAARNGSYPNYRDTARQRDLPCPHGGYRNVRAEVLDDAFAALLSRPLPETWRADIAAMRADRAADTDWDAIDARRARLISERERLKFQHRNGLLTDADLLREVDRIRLALEALPVRGDDLRDEAAQASAGQTLAALSGSWAAADLSERAELVRLILLPEGLRYDLVRTQVVGVRPRASLLAPLRLAWHDWRAQDDGWLVRDAEPAAVTLQRRAGGAHSSD